MKQFKELLFYAPKSVFCITCDFIGNWSAPITRATAANLSWKKTCMTEVITLTLCIIRQVKTTFPFAFRNLRELKNGYIYINEYI